MIFKSRWRFSFFITFIVYDGIKSVDWQSWSGIDFNFDQVQRVGYWMEKPLRLQDGNVTIFSISAVCDLLQIWVDRLRKNIDDYQALNNLNLMATQLNSALSGSVQCKKKIFVLFRYLDAELWELWDLFKGIRDLHKLGLNVDNQIFDRFFAKIVDFKKLAVIGQGCKYQKISDAQYVSQNFSKYEVAYVEPLISQDDSVFYLPKKMLNAFSERFCINSSNVSCLSLESRKFMHVGSVKVDDKHFLQVSHPLFEKIVQAVSWIVEQNVDIHKDNYDLPSVLQLVSVVGHRFAVEPVVFRTTINSISLADLYWLYFSKFCYDAIW